MQLIAELKARMLLFAVANLTQKTTTRNKIPFGNEFHAPFAAVNQSAWLHTLQFVYSSNCYELFQKFDRLFLEKTLTITRPGNLYYSVKVIFS